MYRNAVIPVFIPHIGCPHACAFCDQRSISGHAGAPDPSSVSEIVERHLATLSRRGAMVEIGFYGGSFTGIPRGLQEAYLAEAGIYIRQGKVDGVRISTRPDLVDQDTLQFLKARNVRMIELGVQSMDDEVLSLSRRGHTSEQNRNAAVRVKQQGFRLGLQTMLGLPGDTPEKAFWTAREVISLNPDAVRIYPAVVVRGTEMEAMYQAGTFTPWSLDQAVDVCADLLPMYESNNIQIIRMGLQATERISIGKDVVAGPFHPAFRQLVEARVMRDALEKLVGDNAFRNVRRLSVRVAKGRVSDAVGQKRSNVLYLQEKYGIGELQIRESRYEDDRDAVDVILVER